MGLVEVTDAIARKAASVTGMKGCSGASSSVGAMPMEIPTTPWGIVYLGEGTAAQGTKVRYDDTFEVRVYVPKAGLPAAYGTLLAFPDLFEQAWRTGRSLDGTCDDSRYLGHGRVRLERWGTDKAGVEYLVVPIRIGVIRLTPAALSPT